MEEAVEPPPSGAEHKFYCQEEIAGIALEYGGFYGQNKKDT